MTEEAGTVVIRPKPCAWPSFSCWLISTALSLAQLSEKATGTPSHGGFLYYEVLEILQGAARAHDIVGIDLVEVAPDYDPTGSTAILAAQVLLNFLGFIFHARASRAGQSPA